MKNNEIFEILKKWWNCSNSQPLIRSTQISGENGLAARLSTLNKFWPNEHSDPDIDSQVKEFKNFALQTKDKYIYMPHLYGSRGVPMAMALYLGGRVKFTDTTVWIEPVIDSLENLELNFDLNNTWFKHSSNILKRACEKLSDFCCVSLPDLGDYLTCLSLLRGAENLLMDLFDHQDIILKQRDVFLNHWKQAHSTLWNIYSKYYPGDCNWLGWAPGKTYVVQSDFSAMISPEHFRLFVVPELESLSEYLDYMIWHLDGVQQIRHLDILLDLPFIKGIQWVPGAGNPPASHWLDMLKKIQNRKKCIYCFSESKEETEILKKELQPNGLFIHELL